MTKKRFKHHMGLICEKRDEEYYSFTVKEVCDLLNALNDENEQLKQDLKIIEEHRKQETEYTARLEEENKQLQKDCTALIYNNQEYRKENEKLKQAIAETEKMVQSTYGELTKLRCFKKNVLRIKHSWDYLMEAIQYD